MDLFKKAWKLQKKRMEIARVNLQLDHEWEEIMQEASEDMGAFSTVLPQLNQMSDKKRRNKKSLMKNLTDQEVTESEEE